MDILEYKSIMCENCNCRGEDIKETKITRLEEKECTTLHCVNYNQK